MKSQDLKSNILFHLSSKTESVAHGFTNLFHARRLENASVATAGQINTHMTLAELNTLYDLAKDLGNSAKVLEIGSYLGASSCFLAAALSMQNGQLFCVDTWQNETMPEGEYKTFLEFQKNTSGVANHITCVKKNSKDLVESDISLPLNLVFIDGNHSYEFVKNDYEIVSSWIVDHGILAFHDCIHFSGVSRTIGEALASGIWQIGGHVDNLLWLTKVERGFSGFTHPL